MVSFDSLPIHLHLSKRIDRLFDQLVALLGQTLREARIEWPHTIDALCSVVLLHQLHISVAYGLDPLPELGLFLISADQVVGLD